jgi:hypothetical protein
MMFNLRFDLECAVRDALPAIRRSLDKADLECGLDDDALAETLVESLVNQVTGYVDRAPTPLRRHEECQECDALILVHQGRTSWDDPGDEEGAWYTHCTVCLEEWPCPEAGELDEEAVEGLQARYTRLVAIPHESRSPRQHQELRKLHRDLAAEARLPERGS